MLHAETGDAGDHTASAAVTSSECATIATLLRCTILPIIMAAPPVVWSSRRSYVAAERRICPREFDAPRHERDPAAGRGKNRRGERVWLPFPCRRGGGGGGPRRR